MIVIFNNIMQKKINIATNFLKGVILIVSLWLINTFIAFVPFSVESNTRYIILIWIIIDTLIIYALTKLKYFNAIVIISSLIFIALISFSYFLPLNSNVPQEAIDLNNQISEQNENKYDYAKNLFFEVEKKYTSPIRQYLLEPWKVFIIKDFEYFWNLKEGEYVDSNIQGRVYKKLLILSERFTEDEVIIHQSFCSNSPHLLVKIYRQEQEIWADFWAVDNFPREGIDEIYEFGMRTKRPCDLLIGEAYVN